MLFVNLKTFINLKPIATLSNCACLLPPLANVNWSVFLQCFHRPCKFITGKMVLLDASYAVIDGGAQYVSIKAS